MSYIASTVSPPSGSILSLLSSLSNPADHNAHEAALSARDAALASSPDSYGSVCVDLARVLAAPSPHVIPRSELDFWVNHAGANAVQLYCNTEQGWSQLREIAGLVLKNALIRPPWDMVTPEAQALASQPHLRRRMILPLAFSHEIKQILIRGMIDSNTHIRKVSSTIIAACTVQIHGSRLRKNIQDDPIHPPLPLNEWADLPSFLALCLENGVRLYGESIYSTLHAETGVRQGHDSVQYALLGALQTLSKMLEDAAATVEQNCGPISFPKIVSAFILLLQSPRILEKHHSCPENLNQALKDIERVKLYALECSIFLLDTMPSTLIVMMEQFLGILSSLSSDPSADVRKLVCRSIVSLLKTRTEYIRPHVVPISHFMLRATTDADQDVALEACEYWLTIASLDSDTCSTEMSEAVKALLPQIIPVLVKGMVYPPEKVEELMELNQADEIQGDDHAKDIAPVFHKSNTKGGGTTAISSHNDIADEDDEESDDDSDDDAYDEREWSLRTCSAAALDSLSVAYPNEDLLPHLLPVLQQSLGHADPWVREAGVLALGAVSSGCYQQLGAHMSQIHPFLMGHLVSPDSLPQLKSISVWTLSRYADWAAGQVIAGIQPDLLARLTESILVCVASNNRRVQLAACSAISDIVERLPELMEYYVEAILDCFAQAVLRYQTRSLLVLLDAIGTIADFVGSSIWKGSSIHRCLTSMIRIWGQRASKNPFDRPLLSLMESIASIAASGGVNIQPFALEFFENAMFTIELCSLSLAAADYDVDDTDPIVCATDLLDGLVEGLGANFSSLVLSSSKYGHTFLNVLRTLISHDVAAVRMSGFALMGDLAKYSPLTIHEGIKELIQEAIYNVDPSYPLVCNNAVWALGEICVKCKGNPVLLEPFAADIVQNLIIVLMSSRDEDDNEGGMAVTGLAENAASTLGRLAIVNPAFVARDVSRCLIGWCEGMSKISDLSERRDAFIGFIQAVRLRPECVLESATKPSDAITSILLAIVSWHIPDGCVPSASMLRGPYQFKAFPLDCRDLIDEISLLLQLVMPLVGWDNVRYRNDIPANVKVLLRDTYKLN